MDNTDNILNSLNTLKRAEASGHFYAGIRAKMERANRPPVSKSFAVKPAFLSAVLAVFLFVNIAALSFLDKKREKLNDTAGVQAFAGEYNLTTKTFGQ